MLAMVLQGHLLDAWNSIYNSIHIYLESPIPVLPLACTISSTGHIQSRSII